MPTAETTLITSRRNFLVRALGFTAAGASVTIPIITVEDLRQRCEYHAKALEQACREYYAGLEVEVLGNRMEPDYVREHDTRASWIITAKMPIRESRWPAVQQESGLEGARSS